MLRDMALCKTLGNLAMLWASVGKDVLLLAPNNILLCYGNEASAYVIQIAYHCL